MKVHIQSHLERCENTDRLGDVCVGGKVIFLWIIKI